METKSSDYSTLVRISASPEAVFRALTMELAEWWGKMDHPVEKKGAVFTVSWGEPWYRFEVIDYSPQRKLIWKCIDANQIIDNLEGVQKEWVGTKLHWTIDAINSKEVELSLVHEGLVPTFTCYDFCSSTWDRFITTSLKEYLEA